MLRIPSTGSVSNIRTASASPYKTENEKKLSGNYCAVTVSTYNTKSLRSSTWNDVKNEVHIYSNTEVNKRQKLEMNN